MIRACLFNAMTCSICQQNGHTKTTCIVVIKYIYDDFGIKCRINPKDETDFQPCQPYCYNCGHSPSECDCVKYIAGKWFNENKGKWVKRP